MNLENQVLNFSDLASGEIRALLQQHQFVLNVDEALTIQYPISKYPPTLAKCVPWFTQKSEPTFSRRAIKHLYYQSYIPSNLAKSQ